MAQSSQSPKSHLRKPLTAERLRELLHYDPETGAWTWLKLPVKNQLKPGDKAGCINSLGYLKVKIDGRHYAASRLAFLYMRDRWPAAEIDHKDGDPGNGCFSNLREATRSQNMMNTHRWLKGASWDKRSRKWLGQIMIRGRNIHLGYFDTPEAAHEAYANKALELFGEFARLDYRRKV
jgi:hypothetical protein